MFEALENNPTVRERVLGLTAIGAILIGGATGVDTMLTSGWQLGGDGANAAPVIYADTLPQYQDDASRDWSVSPPRRVQLAAQDSSKPALVATPALMEPTNIASLSTGEMPNLATVEIAQPLANNQQQTVTRDGQQEADQRFQAIESDVQQANAALKDDAVDPSSETPPQTESDGAPS